MNKYFIALIGFFTIFMSSCTYTNPGFPEELRQYLPYEKGQTLTFTNKENEIQQYTIYSISVDKEEKHAWNCKCHRWEASMEIVDTNKRLSLLVTAHTEDSRIDNRVQVFVYVNGTFFEKGFAYNPFSETIIKDLSDTIVLTNENDSTIIVRNKGIIKYIIEEKAWNIME